MRKCYNELQIQVIDFCAEDIVTLPFTGETIQSDNDWTPVGEVWGGGTF